MNVDLAAGLRVGQGCRNGLRRRQLLLNQGFDLVGSPGTELEFAL